MLPTQQLLEKVSKEIKRVPNRRGEHLRKVHYGCFLLGYKAGLRVSEAVKFDLASKTPNGLYRIERPKGKKERLVYIPKKVIRELKKHNWKPNSTNRWNFYHFLKKIKRELNISKSIELSPHTLRRGFTTYQAESGMPLPVLQKLLGHSSIRTTALYWKNIYQEPDNEVGPVLAGKFWLERPKLSQSKKPPITEIFPETPKTPKPIFTVNQPVISNKKPTGEDNSLSTQKVSKKGPGILISQIPSNPPAKFPLNPTNKKFDQLKNNQPLALIANNEEKSTKKEAILLAKIKQLEEQLKQTQQLVQQEKQRADNCQQQLNAVVKVLKQWQKINYYKYYKQLEKEQEAKIEQPLLKPPNK